MLPQIACLRRGMITLDFSPLCIFICVFKTSAREETKSHFFVYLYDKFNLGVRREPSSLLFANNSHTCADLAKKLPHQLLSLSALNEPLGAHPPQKQSVGHFSLMTFIRRIFPGPGKFQGVVAPESPGNFQAAGNKQGGSPGNFQVVKN